jgi:CBS domain-containing protein/anti-sigma regulatory factor (Ser/Thr protein kinase)
MTDETDIHITRLEELFYDLRIEDVMTQDLHVVEPDMHIAKALDLFKQARISGAPVVLNDELVGIIGIEELIRSLGQGDIEAMVREYMSSEVVTVRSLDPVVEAVKAFAQTSLGRLPVTDKAGKLVGIVTRGDITRGVLWALQSDYQEEEVRRYRASHLFEDIVSDRTSLILRYSIKPRDFEHGGEAPSHLKRALRRLGAKPQIARRCGIAVYEAEMNLIIHTENGGVIRVEIEPHRIFIEAVDDGPGIEDIELAMKPGYSTAPEEIRKMGFGAGIGLNNIERCVDEMLLESSPGEGTRLQMTIHLQAIGSEGTHHFQGGGTAA